MTNGQKFSPDPQAWAVVDGKLYLNSDRAALTEWQKDTTGKIRKAEEQWKLANQ